MVNTKQWPWHFTGRICSPHVAGNIAYRNPMVRTPTTKSVFIGNRTLRALSASPSSRNQKQIKETVHVRLSMSRHLIQLLNSPKRIQIKRVLGAK